MFGFGPLDIFELAQANLDRFGGIGEIDRIARIATGAHRAFDQGMAAVFGLGDGKHAGEAFAQWVRTRRPSAALRLQCRCRGDAVRALYDARSAAAMPLSCAKLRGKSGSALTPRTQTSAANALNSPVSTNGRPIASTHKVT